MVDRRAYSQPAAGGPVHEDNGVVMGCVEFVEQRMVEHSCRSRIPVLLRQLLVHEQLGLDGDPQTLLERLDLVADGGERAVRERHQPGRAHAHRRARRGHPFGLPGQQARPEIEDPLV